MTGQLAGRLAERSWPSLTAGVCVLVPVGSMEQHGPHLPLRTDTIIAEAVATRVAAGLELDGGTITVAPAVEYGSSGEHQDFPGTVSVGHDVLRLVLLELGRSALTWAERLVLVNGHGGNVTALAEAVTQLRREGRAVGWTSCGVADGDAHAGDVETSLLLHLAPQLVGPDRSPGVTTPAAKLMGELREYGVRAVSASGVLGDPSTATAERGRTLLAQIVDRVGAEVHRMTPDRHGRLR